MTYELATEDELQAIYDLVQYTIKTVYPKYYPREVVDFFCEHHSKTAIEQDLANGYVSVLKVDDEIVATGCFVENHITRVYVSPEHQKKGYGTFIVNHIEGRIGEKYDKAYLDASLPAATLYERLGYHTVKHEKYPVENGVVLAYEIMEKELHKTTTAINYNGRKFVPQMNSQIGKVSTPTIREANRADLNEILHLYLYLHEESVPADTEDLRKTWENIINDANHHLIVCEVDHKIVASCVCVIIPNLTRNVRPYAFVENVVTHGDYRNKGYATACLNFAKQIAEENHCYKMMLLTGSKEKSTLRFYQNAGYNSADKTAFIQWINM